MEFAVYFVMVGVCVGSLCVRGSVEVCFWYVWVG